MTFSITIKTVADLAAEALASARSGSTLTRRQFCLALVTHGILSNDDAVLAAKGEWPTALDSFLEYAPLTEAQITEARIEWAAAGIIERMNPLVLTLGSWLGLTDAQIDAMFVI